MTVEEVTTHEPPEFLNPDTDSTPRGLGDYVDSHPSRYGRQGLTRENMLLTALFIAGIACVYFLSLRGGPQTASAQEKLTELRVNNAISGLTQIDNTHETAMEVVHTFYHQASQRQIPLKNLKANPFVFKIPGPVKPVAAAKTKQTPAPVKKANDQAKQAMKEVANLKLQSILTGSHGAMAMISNNLLTKGQRIVGWTVADIEPRRVVLTWRDKTYVLKISQ